MYQAIIFSAAAVLTFVAWYLYKRLPRTFDLALRVVAVLFYAMGFFRLMLSDSFIVTVINGGYFEGVGYIEKSDVLQSILRWGYVLNYSVLPVAVFLKSPLCKKLSVLVAFPFTVLSTVFFHNYMRYFLDSLGRGLHFEDWFRYTYFSLELILALFIPLALVVSTGWSRESSDELKTQKRSARVREWVEFAIAVPFAIIAVMPVYIPQSLFGYKYDYPSAFGIMHTLWMVGMVVAILALYFIFRFRGYKERYTLCLFLSLTFLIHTNSIFLMGFTLSRLPVQLCSIASYFFVVCVVFKLKKMFHFCFLANIVGAMIAILIPSLSDATLSFWGMHYIVEHIYTLTVPAVCMALRVFPRVNIRSFRYLLVGFTAYFTFAFLLGTFINYNPELTNGQTVNYFYIFDLEFAFETFPFLTFAGEHYFTVGKYTVYPIIVCAVYVVYQLLCMAFYWVVTKLYAFEDDRFELRLSAIDLYEKITGKQSRRPRCYRD